ncbi:Hint domain-containing protein [Candidatus Gottesmanbacteria bacterium]|nr:Hint domain-containing protein [Candidatus Gottesmanbacteria bacterium]
MKGKGIVHILIITGVVLLIGVFGFVAISRRFSSTPTILPTVQIECIKDADCPSNEYRCEEIEGEGTISPDGGLTTRRILKGVCKLKEGGQCRRDSDCIAGFMCYQHKCTQPVGRECTGPADTSCPVGFECIQGCGPPVVRQEDSPLPYFCQLKGYKLLCPICLAKDTLIDTPNGAVPVQDAQIGMAVWTVNIHGERIVTQVIRTAKTPVPGDHQVVHIVLADDREIFVSPKHQVGDGRSVGALSAGDVLDGSRVVSIERGDYTNDYTYDILPSGDTGFYWANGILFDSTLH